MPAPDLRTVQRGVKPFGEAVDAYLITIWPAIFYAICTGWPLADPIGLLLAAPNCLPMVSQIGDSSCGWAPAWADPGPPQQPQPIRSTSVDAPISAR
jgi:hypothetical protein